MKQQTTKSLAIRSSLVLAVALTFVLAIWSPVQAQDAKPLEGKMDAKMMEHCQEIMDQKHAMMKDFKAKNAELSEHVAEMNRTPEDKKMDVMAAVITHMVELRITIDEQQAKMEEKMMQHMMTHMQMDKETMSQCPMMMGMKDTNEISTGEHKEHHKEQK